MFYEKFYKIFFKIYMLFKSCIFILYVNLVNRFLLFSNVKMFTTFHFGLGLLQRGLKYH